MKKSFIIAFGAVILPILSASAVGVAGYRLDGTIDESFQNRSVPAKVTILQCGQGRMRQVTNYTVKCAVKQKDILRNTQAQKSQILQKSAPRYRATKKPVVARSTKGEKSIEAQQAKFWRDRAEWKDLAEGAKVEQAKQARIAEERARIDALEKIWWIENFKNLFQ